MGSVPIYPRGIATHEAWQCEGEWCCIHNPSPHGMQEWPIIIRMDRRALAERECVHGVGHPDPDSLAWLARTYGQDEEEAFYEGIHGCDGCCGRAMVAAGYLKED